MKPSLQVDCCTLRIRTDSGHLPHSRNTTEQTSLQHLWTLHHGLPSGRLLLPFHLHLHLYQTHFGNRLLSLSILPVPETSSSEAAHSSRASGFASTIGAKLLCYRVLDGWFDIDFVVARGNQPHIYIEREIERFHPRNQRVPSKRVTTRMVDILGITNDPPV